MTTTATPRVDNVDVASFTGRWPVAGAGTQIGVLTARSLRPLRRPGMLLASLFEPLTMLILFSTVFRSIGDTPGFPANTPYIAYLLPATMIAATMSNGLQSGIALTNDLRNGVIARLKAMPIRLFSVLLARSFADATRGLIQLLTLTTLGIFVFSYSPTGGVTGGVAAVVIALTVGWTLSWVYIALACVVRNPQLLQTIMMMVQLPLLFASNAFVPTEGMPAWLRVIAEVNPISHAITAIRNVSSGQFVGSELLFLAGLCSVVVLVAAPIASRAFRR